MFDYVYHVLCRMYPTVYAFCIENCKFISLQIEVKLLKECLEKIPRFHLHVFLTGKLYFRTGKLYFRTVCILAMAI